MLSVTACSPVAIYVEPDPNVSFAGLERYGWVATPPAIRGEANAPDLAAQARGIVDEELAARGYERRDDDTADFLVRLFAALETDRRTVTIDSYYGTTQSGYLARAGRSRDYPRTTAARQTAVQQVEQGSLILDVFTPDPRRRIWRAYARSVVAPGADAAARERRIREAVRGMLERFPTE